VAANSITAVANVRAGERFFLVMAALLATVVLASFTPTFYLRPFLLPQGVRYGVVLPFHLYLHGACLTAWYLLLLTQALLVANGRPDWHRRLGVIGVGIAVGMVASTFLAVARSPNADQITATSFNPDLQSIAGFALCVALAVAARGKPSEHKRLMLMASVAPIPFALARVVIVASNAGLQLPPQLSVGTAFLLLAAILAYDLIRERRPNWGTMKGIVALFVVAPLLVRAFVASGLYARLAELAG
jgi:hypothetical protein